MDHGGLGVGGGYVLVVDDDPDVGEAIVRTLRTNGCRAVGVHDFALALTIAAGTPPAVIVIDGIVDTPEHERLLRRLDALELSAAVVLLRYAPGGAGAFRRPNVTVVGGEDWLERLPDVVARHVYARAY